MSDAAFREALDAYHDALLGCQCSKCGGGDPADAAHARILALYAERENDYLAALEQVALDTIRMEQGRAERQGEVYYVGAWRLDGSDRDLPAVALDAPFKPGDKVRVSRIADGEKTI